MRLDHEFTVPVPAAQAWHVLLDVERIAPCMPGATVTSVDGDDFDGHGQGQGRPDHGHLRRARRASSRRTRRAASP